MKNSHFLSIAGLTLMIVACDPPPESKSERSRNQPGSKLKHPQNKRAAQDGARVALEAHGQSISPADADAIENFEDFGARWNRAAAPFVRDYLDPNVPADRWVKEASQHVKELRAVYIEMHARTVAIEDAGIRGTFEDITANYRTKLDCVTRLHNAVAQGDTEAEQQVQQELSNAVAEGQRLAKAMIERLRPYVDPQVIAAIAKKRGKEAAELTRQTSTP